MLNYVETASISTILPVESVPCRQSQEHPATTSVCPYAIGPIDPTQLHTLHAHLACGAEIALLVPTQITSTILNDPQCKEGYEAGYLNGELEDPSTIAQLVNQIYAIVSIELRDNWCVSTYAWTVGYVLGALASLAESERTLACVGLAHLCFLLSSLSSRLSPEKTKEVLLMNLWGPHCDAVKAYRERLRSYRLQGKGFEEAQQLALVGNAQ